MAAYRRRYHNRRQMSLPFKRAVRRIDRQDLNRRMGRWWYVNIVNTLTTAANKKGIALTLTKLSSGDPTNIYGMDMLITIGFKAETDNLFIQGALAVCHVRSGQSDSDFAASNLAMPIGYQADSYARYRAFLPFSLSAVASQQRQILTIPYRFFRGKSVKLLPGEDLKFLVMFPASTGNDHQVDIGIVGRYRYVLAANT